MVFYFAVKIAKLKKIYRKKIQSLHILTISINQKFDCITAPCYKKVLNMSRIEIKHKIYKIKVLNPTFLAKAESRRNNAGLNWNSNLFVKL